MEFQRFTHAYDYDDTNFFDAKSVKNDNSLGRLLRDMRRVHKLIRGFLSYGNEKAREQPDNTTRSAFIAAEVWSCDMSLYKSWFTFRMYYDKQRGAELESSPKVAETIDVSPPDGGSTEYEEDINHGGTPYLGKGNMNGPMRLL